MTQVLSQVFSTPAAQPLGLSPTPVSTIEKIRQDQKDPLKSLSPEKQQQLAAHVAKAREYFAASDQSFRDTVAGRWHAGTEMIACRDILKMHKGWEAWLKSVHISKTAAWEAIQLRTRYKTLEKLLGFKGLTEAKIAADIIRPTKTHNTTVAATPPSSASSPSTAATGGSATPSPTGTVFVDSTATTVVDPERDIIRIHNELVRVVAAPDVSSSNQHYQNIRACITLLSQLADRVLAAQQFEEHVATPELARFTPKKKA